MLNTSKPEKVSTMRKIFNFSPGPAMLPEQVLLQAQAELLDWNKTGMSISEIGHRGPEFKMVAEQAEADLRELMDIPKNYHVLFLAGGATTQFSMVPINLMTNNPKADYIDTGVWSKKAIDEAKRYGDVNIAAHTEHENHLAYIPHQEEWNMRKDAAYLHYTPNETIDGFQFQWVPETGNVPLVADMTSMILSRPVNVNDFGIIYAGAQKNLGIAGLTIVVIREDLVKDPFPYTPLLYSYKLQSEHHSFYNTPPTFAWYVTGLMLAWMKAKGGIPVIYAENLRKANKLYSIIDAYPDFYINRVRSDYRSLMNIMFYLRDENLTPEFLKEAETLGMTNLRGHRVSGGVRASIYNSMPEEGVDLLADFMLHFVKRYG